MSKTISLIEIQTRLDVIKSRVKDRFVKKISDINLMNHYPRSSTRYMKASDVEIPVEFDKSWNNIILKLRDLRYGLEDKIYLSYNDSAVFHELSILSCFDEFKTLVDINNLVCKISDPCYSYLHLVISRDKIEHRSFSLFKNNLKYGFGWNSTREKNIADFLYEGLKSEIYPGNPIFSGIGIGGQWNRVLMGFCLFWGIVQTNKTRFGMMSKKVDRIWHYCVGDTKLYQKLCDYYGGNYISHLDGDDDSRSMDCNGYIDLLTHISENHEKYPLSFDIWPCPKSLFEKHNLLEVIKTTEDNLVTSVYLDDINSSSFYRYLLAGDKINMRYVLIRAEGNKHLIQGLKDSGMYLEPDEIKSEYSGKSNVSESRTRPGPPSGWTRKSSTDTTYNPSSSDDASIGFLSGAMLDMTINNDSSSSHSSHSCSSSSSSCSSSSCSSSSCSSGSSCASSCGSSCGGF